MAVKAALDRGHKVTAFARHPDKLVLEHTTWHASAVISTTRNPLPRSCLGMKPSSGFRDSKRSTFPPSTACAANDRVLKNRAAHSHLSNLTWTLAESSVLDMASCLSARDPPFPRPRLAPPTIAS